MTLFWIFAGVMMMLALLWVIPTLAKGSSVSQKHRLKQHKQQLKAVRQAFEQGVIDETSYQQQRSEIAEQLLQLSEGDEASQSTGSPALAVICGLFLLCGTVGLYLVIGEPTGIQANASTTPQSRSAASAPPQQAAPTAGSPEAASIEESIRSLEAKLENDPGNVDSWVLLARSYATIGQMEATRDAYERAYLLDPERPEISYGYAEAMANASGTESIPKRAIALLESTLQTTPDYPQAMFMLAVARSQQGRPEESLTLLESLYAKLDPAQQEADQMLSIINNVRQQMGQAPMVAVAANDSVATTSASPPTAPQATSTQSTGLQVNLSLSSELAGQVSDSDVLFVFVKAVDGPNMPLAVQRLSVSDLPLRLTLNDEMAMVEGMQMSRFDQIYVEARVSRQGTPAAQPGDLEGTSPALDQASTTDITLVIDRVVQ